MLRVVDLANETRVTITVHGDALVRGVRSRTRCKLRAEYYAGRAMGATMGRTTRSATLCYARFATEERRRRIVLRQAGLDAMHHRFRD